MLVKIKFNNTETLYDCELLRISDHRIQLNGNFPHKTNGFMAYSADGKTPLEDYSDYTTIYYELEWGMIVSNDGSTFPPTLAELKQRKRDEIAADRFNYETGGITVDGAQIKTDRESVALLKGAYDEACDNPNYTVNWKAANGFVTLNAEQVITIYQRVKAHVQSSFDAEMMINQQIDAVTTEEQLNEIVWVDPN